MGGQDFDNRLIGYLRRQFQKKNPEASDPGSTPSALQKLRREAERAKRVLSSQPQVPLPLHNCYMRVLSSQPQVPLHYRYIIVTCEALQRLALSASTVTFSRYISPLHLDVTSHSYITPSALLPAALPTAFVTPDLALTSL